MNVSWNVPRTAVLLSLTVLQGCHETEVAATTTPASIRVVPNPVMLAAGDRMQLAAEVDDGAGKPIGGSAITFASSDPARVSVSSTGLARSEGAPGKAQIVVSSAAKETRVEVTVTTGPARSIVAVSGMGQSGAVGTVLSQPAVVRVLDGKRNPVPGAEVRFAAADGGIVDPAEEATNAEGEAETRWTLGRVASVQRLSASVNGAQLPAVRFTARAGSGPVARLTFAEGRVTNIAPGENHTLELKITDAQGNAKQGVAVQWKIESGGGSLSSETSTSDESGVARVVLSTGRRAGNNRVVARVADLTRASEVITRAK